MKCPKCGFTGPDYADLCKKCNYDLTEVRKLFGVALSKPGQKSFLSQLMRPATGSREEQKVPVAAPKISPPSEEEISLSSIESAEEPPQSPPIDLSQIDFSDLEDEVTPEPEPTAEEATSKSEGITMAETDLGLPEIDLSNLELESSTPEEVVSAGKTVTPPAVTDEISLDGLLEAGESEIQFEEILSDEKSPEEDKDADDDNDLPPPSLSGAGETPKKRGKRGAKAGGSKSGLEFSGANLYLQRAGFWQRLLAFSFDCCLIHLIMLFFLLGTAIAVKTSLDCGSGFSWPSALQLLGTLFLPFQLAMLLTVITYFTFFHGYTGQTPGKQLFGLKVVHTSGLPLTFGQAFLRWVGYILSSAPLNLGFLWVAIDKNKQGWHDKITDTYVIRTL
ncbi:MAG: RDD family protein [Desulfovibrionales bacterium]|nr:RDD family protein [Desulfovibrionales bacterium]